ncbi:universal stress protein [Alkalitalea saponilacus]|uniref:Nucleotide-binding universal stress protein, UspA family n=1 Tax=Alkalitalea saponilacus TaxID=889453 RepID=A0A1T5DEA3_9BACT|nr:universal stress protein [Alkalitalea saponilacus]SKB70032.1 Nucleotide-binding universal stress protein, UspA family [Alkalitalea saponilacus]
MEEKIITLATHNFQHAQVLQNILDSEGIECFLQNANLIEGAVNASVKIRIRESDLEKAMKIMESIEEPGIMKFTEKKSGRPPKPRILLPVDFSDYSEKASDMALDWASRLNAEITVLHVYFNPVINTLPFSEAYVYDTSLDEMMVDMEEKADADMKIFLKKFKEKNKDQYQSKIGIKHKLLRGVAEEEILHFSEEYQPTVIIMGTRGRNRKANDLIGSVTAEVMELAKVPVLAVPEDFNYQGIDNIKNVLYATNFEESDFKALDKLERIVKPLDVKVFFVHVGPHSESKWDKLKLDGLKKHVEEKLPNIKVECDLIENEDFWVGLEWYIRKNKIDIISLTTRRRNLVARLVNPSIGKKMLFHTNTPMLVFHA